MGCVICLHKKSVIFQISIFWIPICILKKQCSDFFFFAQKLNSKHCFLGDLICPYRYYNLSIRFLAPKIEKIYILKSRSDSPYPPSISARSLAYQFLLISKLVFLSQFYIELGYRATLPFILKSNTEPKRCTFLQSRLIC